MFNDQFAQEDVLAEALNLAEEDQALVEFRTVLVSTTARFSTSYSDAEYIAWVSHCEPDLEYAAWAEQTQAI